MPIFSVIILIQATPREPRAAIASRVLLTYPAHHSHAYLSVIILIQATPREPRAAIASRVLLTYPAHLGIHSHAYLLCHYPNSSNPSGAPSGNCFTCLTHIPSTPGYSSSCLSSLSLFLIRECSLSQHTWVLTHLGILSHTYPFLSPGPHQATPQEPRVTIAPC